MEKGRVSIVIPVYKTEKYLRSCVQSALEQSYDNTEIILVDDGSPDNCPAICDDLVKENEKITVIHKQNGGLSSARNASFSRINGEFLLFLDSDDTLPKDALQNLMNTIQHDKADVALTDRCIKVFEDGGKSIEAMDFEPQMFSQNPIEFACNVLLLKGRAWRSTAVLYRAEPIVKNKIEFPLGYTAEDLVFNLRLYPHIKTLSLFEGSTLNNLKRSGSITSSFNEKLFSTFLFIDGEVKEFLNKSNVEPEVASRLHCSLLARNAAIYITSALNRRNHMEKRKKRALAKKALQNQALLEALKQKNLEKPYFESRIVSLYMSMLLFFMRRGMQTTAINFASFAGKFKSF